MATRHFYLFVAILALFVAIIWAVGWLNAEETEADMTVDGVPCRNDYQCLNLYPQP